MISFYVSLDLIHDLKSELSGDLEELILAMFKPTTYYDAYSLHKAILLSMYLHDECL
jgi:annexin A7/11